MPLFLGERQYISELDVTVSLAPGFADPTQQALVCTERLLVPVRLLDSLNTLQYFPVSDPDPDAFKGKEGREGDTRRNARQLLSRSQWLTVS